jgi:hypothetical protein
MQLVHWDMVVGVVVAVQNIHEWDKVSNLLDRGYRWPVVVVAVGLWEVLAIRYPVLALLVEWLV